MEGWEPRKPHHIKGQEGFQSNPIIIYQRDFIFFENHYSTLLSLLDGESDVITPGASLVGLRSDPRLIPIFSGWIDEDTRYNAFGVESTKLTEQIFADLQYCYQHSLNKTWIIANRKISILTKLTFPLNGKRITIKGGLGISSLRR